MRPHGGERYARYGADIVDDEQVFRRDAGQVRHNDVRAADYHRIRHIDYAVYADSAEAVSRYLLERHISALERRSPINLSVGEQVFGLVEKFHGDVLSC